MKASAIPLFPTLLAALSLGLTASCSHSHRGGSSNYTIDVFFESEPNDFAEEANDFGFLYPDELFIIEGEVYDDGFYYDPFDGFLFTSTEPLVVAFELFLSDPFSDVRIGLYDPVLDETVAYWYESNGYAYGELEVYDGGTDFHLFVEHLSGDTRYELEIESFPYFFAAASDNDKASELSADSAERRFLPRAASTLSEEERKASEGYGKKKASAKAEEEEIDPVVGHAALLSFDPETGAVSRDAFLITAGGSWMGIAGNALVE